MTARFDEVITTRARLREILAEPDPARSWEKASDHIDATARDFIRAAPFALVASCGGDGLIDVSPKGDPAGFVEVHDERTLIIPDRPGNHRMDTFENLLVNPAVGLIFVIPGNTETLRVAGTGHIVRDAAVQARHAVNGRRPVLALVVDVQEVFMHCSKAFVRARVWKPDMWPDRSGVPTLADWMKATVAPTASLDALREAVDRDTVTRLY